MKLVAIYLYCTFKIMGNIIAEIQEQNLSLQNMHSSVNTQIKSKLGEVISPKMGSELCSFIG